MENTEKPIDKFIGKKFKVKGCYTVFNIANINEQNKIKKHSKSLRKQNKILSLTKQKHQLTTS